MGQQGSRSRATTAAATRSTGVAMADRPSSIDEIYDSDDDLHPSSRGSNGSKKLGPRTVKKAHDSDEEEFKAFSGWVNKGIDAIKEVFNDAKDYLVDYGPPYIDAGGLDNINNITYACSERETSLIHVHRMLTARYSPNIPDPDDFYNSPLIYAAQFGNYFVMQLLLRAKADVAHTNEMGHHALIAAVIFYQNPEKRPYQIKIVQLLVRCGAEVNLIDKSGHSAIDYCVLNDDLILTRFLLMNGANVSRNNRIFVCKRKSLLDYARRGDAEIFRLVHEKQLQEDEVLNKTNAAKEARRKETDEEKRILKMRARLAKTSSERAAKEEAEQKAENDSLIQAFRQSKIDLALKRERDQVSKDRGEVREPGGWVRAREGGHWQWDRFYKRENPLLSLHDTGRQQTATYRRERIKETYAEKWREATGGTSELDVRWQVDEAFLSEDGLTSGESSPEKLDRELKGQDVDELLGLL